MGGGFQQDVPERGHGPGDAPVRSRATRGPAERGRWAVDEDRLEKNPLEEVEQPKKEQKEAAYLQPDDVQTLLSTIEDHILEVRDAAGRIPDLKWLHQMIRVAVATDLRRGELVALPWDDMDLSNQRLYVRHRGDFRTKGNRERRVPLRGDAEEVLSQMHEPEAAGAVFTDRGGDPVRPNRISKRWIERWKKPSASSPAPGRSSGREHFPTFCPQSFFSVRLSAIRLLSGAKSKCP